jgi:hypothetical protein
MAPAVGRSTNIAGQRGSTAVSRPAKAKTAAVQSRKPAPPRLPSDGNAPTVSEFAQ